MDPFLFSFRPTFELSFFNDAIHYALDLQILYKNVILIKKGPFYTGNGKEYVLFQKYLPYFVVSTKSTYTFS